ncbi:hypothetical protein H0H93_005322, partial [Arthromyces matolae]
MSNDVPVIESKTIPIETPATSITKPTGEVATAEAVEDGITASESLGGATSAKEEIAQENT